MDQFKHRTALAVRELQQAQQELWAIRGATTGQMPADLEQDFAALKKKVVCLKYQLPFDRNNLFHSVVGH